MTVNELIYKLGVVSGGGDIGDYEVFTCRDGYAILIEAETIEVHDDEQDIVIV